MTNEHFYAEVKEQNSRQKYQLVKSSDYQFEYFPIITFLTLNVELTPY